MMGYTASIWWQLGMVGCIAAAAADAAARAATAATLSLLLRCDDCGMVIRYRCDGCESFDCVNDDCTGARETAECDCTAPVAARKEAA